VRTVAIVTDKGKAKRYERGERHWRETFSCGHTQLTVTFIGDFDFEASHRDLPAVCYQCPARTLVKRESTVAIPLAEWAE